MENVVSILEEQVDSDDIGQIKTVFLEVGKLRYIVPEIMITGFQNIPKSDKLTKAELKITELPVKIKCKVCGEEHEIQPDRFKCPGCDSDKVEMISGDELVLKGIEW